MQSSKKKVSFDSSQRSGPKIDGPLPCLDWLIFWLFDILSGMNAGNFYGARAWHGALPESLRWVPVAGGIVAPLTGPKL